MKRLGIAIIILGATAENTYAEGGATAEGEITLNECEDNNPSFHTLIVGKEDIRDFSSKNTTYQFKFLQDIYSVKIDEKKRKSRFAQDVSTIVDYYKTKKTLSNNENYKCAVYTKKNDRSDITIVTLDKNNKELYSSKAITGPKEHWYLSADMPVSNIKQLSYDATKNKVIEKEKPASFYLGINYKVGDVVAGQFNDHLGNIIFKFMLKASSKPTESFGLGVGYSFNDFVDVFIARVRTKDDTNTGENTLGHTDSTVYGISFNISKGIEWLKE